MSLPDGRAAVLGGWAGRAGELDTIEVFDPASGQWTLGGVLLEKRKHLAATVLADGKVLVTGGSVDLDGRVRITATAEVWHPATGVSEPAPPMLLPRYGHELIPLSRERLLVVGGLISKTGKPEQTELLQCS